MALKQDIVEEEFGYTVPDAYIKFAYMGWSDITHQAVAQFSVWATPTAEAEGKRCITNIEVDLTNLFPAIQAQAYAEIKKMDKYKDAVDV